MPFLQHVSRSFNGLDYRFQRAYVSTIMSLFSRLIAASSQTDEVIQELIEPLPEGFVACLEVLPAGPRIMLQKKGNYFISLPSHSSLKPDISIRFKHVTIAYLLFTFQENTATAFANNRMQLDGDTAIAMRIVRCLNRIQAIHLPKILGEKAVKTYPEMLWSRRFKRIRHTAGRMMWNLKE